MSFGGITGEPIALTALFNHAAKLGHLRMALVAALAKHTKATLIETATTLPVTPGNKTRHRG
jgi:hypothetical protein